MSVTVKRKRGRPRHDEPREINEFDMALIEEYQKHPALYDRSHPQYRNREHQEPQWDEIAQRLGYKVAMLKDRMNQLRNRYNLEKRRVEALQGQYKDSDITSQWVLFESLKFLSDHIKTRRSWAQAIPMKPRTESNSSNDSEDQENVQSFVNGNDIAAAQAQTLQMMNNNHRQSLGESAALESYNGYDAVMNSTTVCTDPAVYQRQSSNGNTYYIGDEKFKAFGQFLTSALIEMNEKDALVLIEKFTSDIVKSMLTDLNK